MSTRRALFLDRDGTIIRERHYLSDPDGVELIDGAADALRAFRTAGYALIIVTNQSGIARGLYSEAQFEAVQQRVEQVLERADVHIDAVFFCPHHPDFTGYCDCRKPGLGLYRAAADRLGVDLAASIYVGDRIADVLPAQQLGGRGYLVRTGYTVPPDHELPAGVEIASDLVEIARREGVLHG